MRSIWIKGYAEEFPLLGDEDEFLELQTEENGRKKVAGKSDSQIFLDQIQSEASMEKDLNPSEDTGAIDLMDTLADVPDGPLLRELFEAEPEEEDAEIPAESPDKGVVSPGMADTLRRCLWCLGNYPSEDEIFDSIFRLVMFLRHWKRGCDHRWIKDPRTFRKRSPRLNWYQCLGPETDEKWVENG